jgi:hypothetical protein
VKPRTNRKNKAVAPGTSRLLRRTLISNKSAKPGTILRRDFLASGLGTTLDLTAFSGLGVSPLAATEYSPKAKLRFGLTTYQWGRDWNIPALIANCGKAGLTGLELRTCLHYAHGVEVTLTTPQRAEVRKRFADSPARLVSKPSGVVTYRPMTPPAAAARQPLPALSPQPGRGLHGSTVAQRACRHFSLSIRR